MQEGKQMKNDENMMQEKQPSTERVRRFRQSVAELGYHRIEIVADEATIKRLRDVAKARNIPTYEALEIATKLLVNWHKRNVSGNA